MLPSLELAYALLALPRAPRKTIFEKILPTVDAALEILKCFEGLEEKYCGVGRAGRAKAAEVMKTKEAHAGVSKKGNVTGSSHAEKGRDAAAETGYWDDYCLAQFLRGVCLRYIAYPVCCISIPLNSIFVPNTHLPGFVRHRYGGKSHGGSCCPSEGGFRVRAGSRAADRVRPSCCLLDSSVSFHLRFTQHLRRIQTMNSES
jgi:hypothetical protein